jgi:hypothetical protein
MSGGRALEFDNAAGMFRIRQKSPSSPRNRNFFAVRRGILVFCGPERGVRSAGVSEHAMPPCDASTACVTADATPGGNRGVL